MTKAKSIPWATNALLNECFSLDRETGVLFWNERPRSHFNTDAGWRQFNRTFAGKAAGCPDKQGYIKLAVQGQRLTGHRVVWAIPKSIDLDDVPDEIDHEDLDKSNNRESNLREATHSENGRNTPRKRSNTSGHKGVCFDKQRGKWKARVRLNYKVYTVGHFDTAEEAGVARDRVANDLHGDFARADHAKQGFAHAA